MPHTHTHTHTHTLTHTHKLTHAHNFIQLHQLKCFTKPRLFACPVLVLNTILTARHCPLAVMAPPSPEVIVQLNCFRAHRTVWVAICTEMIAVMCFHLATTQSPIVWWPLSTSWVLASFTVSYPVANSCQAPIINVHLLIELWGNKAKSVMWVLSYEVQSFPDKHRLSVTCFLSRYVTIIIHNHITMKCGWKSGWKVSR